MQFVYPFEKISKKDVGLAGGKGASLGEMTKADIPVPSGFVLSTEAFDSFLAQTDLTQEIQAQLDKVNHKDIASVERASEAIRNLILNAAMPTSIADQVTSTFTQLKSSFVAVRSSATAEDGSAASWAGELDSYLNTTSESLLENVRRCWVSLFTPRAIFYRFEKGFAKSKVSVAVVVQQMVQSEVSGIAFSVHPVTEDRNQIIIEAGWGLGEAIVSGSITPDSYVVDKRDWKIVDCNVSQQERGLYRANDLVKRNEWKAIPTARAKQQKLANTQIVELAKLVCKIEAHYSFPVDIEWAMEGGEFFITQSRPITTLK